MNHHEEGELQALLVRRSIIAEVGSLLGRRRMSAAELARRLGWTQPYLSRRMNGKTAFSTDDLTLISEEFGVPVTDLFGAAAIAKDSRHPDNGCTPDLLNSDIADADIHRYAHVA